MSDAMIDRAARALAREDGQTFSGNEAWYRKQARAVISVLKNPSHEVKRSPAKVKIYYDDFALGDGNVYCNNWLAEEVFNTMIDAILTAPALAGAASTQEPTH